MRYHEERKREKRVTPAEEQDGVVVDVRKSEERVDSVLPTPLTIVSEGRLLIIESDLERALNCAEHLQDKGMICTLCLPKRDNSGPALSTIDSYPLAEVDSVSVDGCFGGFMAMVAGLDGDRLQLSTLFGQESDFFDVVLDLQQTPSYSGQLLPVGYCAPGHDTESIESALQELALMRGRFSKPQFTIVHQKRCLHGRSRSLQCRRCIDICPVEAVRSEGREIAMDHYRCQGCGACALACPADAIEMCNPSRTDMLSGILARVGDCLASCRQAPGVVLHDRQVDGEALRRGIDKATDRLLLIEVEEIGRIGLAELLLLLAHGAGSVALVCAQSCPAETRAALERQMQLGAAILQGLRLPAASLRFIMYPAEQMPGQGLDLLPPDDAGTEPFTRLSPAVPFSLSGDGRSLIRQAARQLGDRYGREPSLIALPAGSPFGTVKIDMSCSFCMACVGACPAGALKAGDDVPRLSLTESRCHQCGLCVAACPEHAIERIPRLLCDHEAAGTPVLLHEAEPFRCIECGEPFAAGAMISRIQEKLTGHWMYNSERKARRLRMCRTCRTQDVFMTGGIEL
jgi:ferredoxin